jgi:hypothetical protein
MTVDKKRQPAFSGGYSFSRRAAFLQFFKIQAQGAFWLCALLSSELPLVPGSQAQALHQRTSGPARILSVPLGTFAFSRYQPFSGPFFRTHRAQIANLEHRAKDHRLCRYHQRGDTDLRRPIGKQNLGTIYSSKKQPCRHARL